MTYVTQSDNPIPSLLDPSPGNPNTPLSFNDIGNMVKMVNRRTGNYDINPGTLSEVEEQQLKRARDKYMFNFPGKDLPMQLANADAYRDFQISLQPGTTGPSPYQTQYAQPQQGLLGDAGMGTGIRSDEPTTMYNDITSGISNIYDKGVGALSNMFSSSPEQQPLMPIDPQFANAAQKRQDALSQVFGGQQSGGEKWPMQPGHPYENAVPLSNNPSRIFENSAPRFSAPNEAITTQYLMKSDRADPNFYSPFGGGVTPLNLSPEDKAMMGQNRNPPQQSGGILADNPGGTTDKTGWDRDDIFARAMVNLSNNILAPNSF